MTALRAEDVSVVLDGRPAVDRVDLEVPPGCLLALVGPNGAGKTTLLRAIAGGLAHTGRIAVAGRDLRRLSPPQRARLLAYLPQRRDVAWGLTAREVVALGRLPHLGFGGREGAADRAAVAAAMAAADVADLAARRVDRLSGGERARVLLARALAQSAPLLLADEPTAALDPFHQLQVMEVLRAEAEAGRAVVAVLHDLALAARFAHRVALIADGRLAAVGTPDAVLTADRLAAVYRVTALAGTHEGAPWLLPWSRV
ncbi:ABC transporter ATP-binding protein [Stella sp.]|uniref:ABC transporter ATP-binding protein n=1 Tax=Stella sp. TaxID=2912054 RepID=UPI0035B46A2A